MTMSLLPYQQIGYHGDMFNMAPSLLCYHGNGLMIMATGWLPWQWVLCCIGVAKADMPSFHSQLQLL